MVSFISIGPRLMVTPTTAKLGMGNLMPRWQFAFAVDSQ